MNVKEIQIKIYQKYEKILDMKKDPRFLKTIGKLVHSKLLFHNRIPPCRALVTLDEALWAGEIEPRIYELLPALLLRRPKFFFQIGPLPDDLRIILNDIRKNKASKPFRGISAKNYLPWVNRVGRKNKTLSCLKTFRLNTKDLEKLQKIQRKTGKTEIAIIREGLKQVLAECSLYSKRLWS